MSCLVTCGVFVFLRERCFVAQSSVAVRKKDKGVRGWETALAKKHTSTHNLTYSYSTLNFGMCINAIFTCIVHILLCSLVHCGWIFVLANFQTVLFQCVVTRNDGRWPELCLLEMWSDFPSAFWNIKGKIYLSAVGEIYPSPRRQPCCLPMLFVTSVRDTNYICLRAL